MDEDIYTIIERFARAQEEEKQRRGLSKTEYTLEWSPMIPYTDAFVELVSQDGIGSCVYEIWLQSEDRRTAVYVGETQELGKRLAEHKSESEQNQSLRNADFSKLLFSYALIGRVIARKSVERALWKLYRYAWNDENGPLGMGVDARIILNETFPELYTIDFNGARKPMYGVKSPVTLP